MHILPQLRKLERKYRDELIVIGVHSAKFPEEQKTENVRRAVQRYRIEHPVVNDSDFRIWQRYGARAWPTLFFLDPEGKVIGRHEGEFPLAHLDRLLAEMIEEFDASGLIDRRPFLLTEPEKNDRVLAFPGKILADAAGGRLFIADSNHDRIIVADGDGQVHSVYGGAAIGLNDGDGATATFNQPQGMALVEESLYVADTENHAIRRIDLQRGQVETVAGTGEQAMTFSAGGPALLTPLSSPWDLAYVEDFLIIAMAGLHQLWALDLTTHTVKPFAGSGNEGLRDGPLPHAWLAQPSGLSLAENCLYFADSETSAIRSVDLPSGHVHTIVGQGLFEFGDSDGVGDAVRLQHPLGVCWYRGSLYIADTYNNKIKRLDPETRRSETFLGSGQPGRADGGGLTAAFYEPGGLSAAADRLYIADTNNHAIRVADLTTGFVNTLALRGL